jgi:hypothetical protein
MGAGRGGNLAPGEERMRSATYRRNRASSLEAKLKKEWEIPDKEVGGSGLK